MISEDAQKAIILRHEQKIFAFALYLIGGDRDKAYELAVSGAADVLKQQSSPDFEEIFLREAAKNIFAKAKSMSFIPTHDDEGIKKYPAEEKRILALVRSAFEVLPIEDRALILMRDQMNLVYSDVGRALGYPEDEARRRTIQARLQLRKRMEEVLRHER